MSKIIAPGMGEITEKANDENDVISHKSITRSSKKEIPKLTKRTEKTADQICNMNRILSKKMKHRSKQNSNLNSTGYIKVFDKSANT
jgi:hypothetical protein